MYIDGWDEIAQRQAADGAEVDKNWIYDEDACFGMGCFTENSEVAKRYPAQLKN